MAERSDRRAVMIGADLARAVAAGAMALFLRVLEHYRRLGDRAHVRSVIYEWARAIAKALAQGPIPGIDGEST